MNEQAIFLLILGAGWHTNSMYRQRTSILVLDETSYLYVSRIDGKIQNSNGHYE